jgi:hypothetical protein
MSLLSCLMGGGSGRPGCYRACSAEHAVGLEGVELRKGNLTMPAVILGRTSSGTACPAAQYIMFAAWLVATKGLLLVSVLLSARIWLRTTTNARD